MTKIEFPVWTCRNACHAKDFWSVSLFESGDSCWIRDVQTLMNWAKIPFMDTAVVGFESQLLVVRDEWKLKG